MPSVTIATEVDIFVRHIDSMYDTLDFLMNGILQLHKPSAKALREFLDDKCEKKTDVDGKTSHVIPPAQLPKFRRLKTRSDRLSIANRTLPKSFLVSLVSQFDSFLGRLVRAIYFLRPELLNSSDRALTFKQLSGFTSLDSAREFIVEKEVETLLRKSHSEQFDWLENKFDLPLRKGLDSWPIFIELTERRNLFVHCNGIVSTQYLDVCRLNGVPLKESVLVGTELGVSKKYFHTASECIFEIGVKLAHVLWRKMLPDDREAADKGLNDVAIDLIRDGKYHLANRLLAFALEMKKHHSEMYRRFFIINRAQSFKWSGDQERAQATVHSEDWSACGDKFKLAIAVLEDRFEDAAEIMRQTPVTEVTQVGYRDWPLFRTFQKSEFFLKAFQDKFNEPFETFDVEIKDRLLGEGEESGDRQDPSQSNPGEVGLP